MTAHLQGTERMLVRLPKWLGDCVMAEPALSALADYWRSKGSIEKLTVVGPAHLLGLWDERFRSGDDAKGTQDPAPRGKPATLGGANLSGANLVDTNDRAALQSAMSQADVALLFTGSFRSAFEVWRAGIPRRIGWSRDLRGLFLTDTMTPMLERGGAPLVNVFAQTMSAWMLPGKSRLPKLGIVGRFPRYAPRPFGSTCIELVASLGIPVLRTKPRLAATTVILERVRNRLSTGGINLKPLAIDPLIPFIVLNAGSRPGSAKGWQDWHELAEILRTETPVVVVCGPGEEATLRDFHETTGREGESLKPLLILDSPPLDLAELAALASLCSTFITADAGARHIASATGTKTLVLFGPTDPRHTADHLEKTGSLAAPQPCGPCHREDCEASNKLACFTEISPLRVASRAHSHSISQALAERGVPGLMGRRGSDDPPLSELRSLASTGDLTAQAQLGSRLWQEAQSPEQEEEAMEWLQKAAERGHSQAQYKLGACIGSGSSSSTDLERALSWFLRSQAQGHPVAAASLRRGRDLSAKAEDVAPTRLGPQDHVQDGDEAWLHFLAKKGFASQQVQLGEWLLEEGRTDKDREDGVAWLLASAGQGKSWAMDSLATAYRDGLGAEKSEAIAWKLLQQAAWCGSESAMIELGDCYLEGRGVGPSNDLAVQWYLRAAGYLSAVAAGRLGKCAHLGLCVSADSSRSFLWDPWDPYDEDSLDYDHETPSNFKGVAWGLSKSEGAKHWLQAAEAGDPLAQYYIGTCYQHGIGVEADLEQAKRWLQAGAAAGNELARGALARGL